MSTATLPRPSLLRRIGAAAALVLLVSPFWRRSWLHRVVRFVVLGAYLYVGILLVMLALEDSFLYHPVTAAQAWLPPPAGLRVEDVETTAGGAPVHGWWSAPPGWTPEWGAVLFFHGNDGNVSQWGAALADWQVRLRTGVLFVDYPGYGKSGGRPSEAGCYAAGEAAFNWLTDHKHVPADRIVLAGRSLGGAVAAELACRRPHRALVLDSAFTSFPDLAQEKYPWLPGRWLVHNQSNNLAKVGRTGAPVFIAHGTADALVPFAHAERLFAAVPGPKRLYAVPGRGHEDGPDAAFFEALTRFLAESAP
jgi:pimeloyl-ACP methyl ester carboxylesterase